MEIRLNLAALEEIRTRMGAPLRTVDWSREYLPPLEVDPIELDRGIEVDIKDVDVNAGGLLGYRGYQVVLYIPDQPNGVIDEIIQNPSRGRRFHVAWCRTLEDMKERGRIERYVVKNGLGATFRVTGLTQSAQEEVCEARLLVCRNCLQHLNLNRSGFSGDLSL